MSITHFILAALVAGTGPLPQDDLTEVAAKSVEYILHLKKVGASASSLEVQIDGVFDRNRSETISRARGARSSEESGAIECTTHNSNRSCRIKDAELFIKINQSARITNGRTKVSVRAVQSHAGSLHVQLMALELTRTAGGWEVSKATLLGES